MKFNPGDKVRFINDIGEGIVLKILSSTSVLVENEYGFEQTHNISELVNVKGSSDYKIDGILFNESVQDKINSDKKAKEESDLQRKFRNLSKYSNDDKLVIDLHIEELIDSHNGLSNYQIIQIQLREFRKGLNNAINNKVKKLIIIHGVGEGVLKSEIRKELNHNYSDYKHFDANYSGGATEIVLK